jgi:hypothetical protein
MLKDEVETTTNREDFLCNFQFYGNFLLLALFDMIRSDSLCLIDQ